MNIERAEKWTDTYLFRHNSTQIYLYQKKEDSIKNQFYIIQSFLPTHLHVSIYLLYMANITKLPNLEDVHYQWINSR